MLIQAILNMQNKKDPQIAVGASGWLADLLKRWIQYEVIIHKGGNNYRLNPCKKEDCPGVDAIEVKEVK